MSSSFVCSPLRVAVTLLAAVPALASADLANRLAPLDTQLHQAAALQQTPLSRAHRNAASGRGFPADDDALYVQHAERDFDQFETAETSGYSTRQRLSVSGGDYQLSPQWLAGGRFGRLEQTQHFDHSDDTVQMRENLVSAFAQWYKNGFTAGSLLGRARGDVNLYHTSNNERVHATTNVSQIQLSIWGRYAFEKNGWIYGPFSRIDAQRARIDALTETTRDVVTQVAKRDANAAVFSMGVHAAYGFDVTQGRLLPHVTLATRKQLKEKRDALLMTQELTVLPGITHFLTREQLSPEDERWHELACGLTIQLDNRLQVSTEATRTLDLHQQDQQQWSVRADWIFP